MKGGKMCKIKSLDKKTFNMIQSISKNANRGIKKELGIEKATGINRINFPLKVPRASSKI
jgi:hypothetical protein